MTTKMYTPKDLQERYGWGLNVCRDLIKRIPGAFNRGRSATKPRWVVSTANLLRWEDGEDFKQAPVPTHEPKPIRRKASKQAVVYPRNRTAAEERARLARMGDLVQ